MKLVSRGTHGNDCDKMTICSCGAPVKTTPCVWNAGEPEQWRVEYAPLIPRKTLLLAVADRAHSLANDGESAPDYRWMDQYIDSAAKRYKATLTPEERKYVARKVRDLS